MIGGSDLVMLIEFRQKAIRNELEHTPSPDEDSVERGSASLPISGSEKRDVRLNQAEPVLPRPGNNTGHSRTGAFCGPGNSSVPCNDCCSAYGVSFDSPFGYYP
jgi:hypothetical protein